MTDLPPNPVDESAEITAFQDHRLSNHVAALTETPLEAEIDARMGLRGAAGHRPAPEDFADVISPEGDSGDVFGSDVVESLFVDPGVYTDDTVRAPDRTPPR